jgi:hypothetical protein
MMRAAAAGRCWCILEYLLNICSSWDESVCSSAAERRHYIIVMLLRERGCSWYGQLICENAARAGNLPFLKWAKEQGVVFTERTMAVSARGGHTDVCAYLRSQNCNWGIRVCNVAAYAERMDTLDWLLEHGCPFNTSKLWVPAAYIASVPILNFLLQRIELPDLPQWQHMLLMAGAKGNLAAVKWIRSWDAEWPAVLSFLDFDDVTVWTWQGAVLEWARAEGCISPV